jgi:hypothetical protein
VIWLIVFDVSCDYYRPNVSRRVSRGRDTRVKSPPPPPELANVDTGYIVCIKLGIKSSFDKLLFVCLSVPRFLFDSRGDSHAENTKGSFALGYGL